MNPIILYAFSKKCRRRQNRSKKYWIHPILLQRNLSGEHLKLEEMYEFYPEKFQEYTRLTTNQFDEVLELITPDIIKQNTNFRKSIPPRIRLLITLRYLATGDNIRSIATNFSIGKTTAYEIIEECNIAIWSTLRDKFVKPPQTFAEWKKIAEGFCSQWQFPNCVGAIDGKHIVINAPPNSGSLYFNYKGTFSIVLLATCDAFYRFTTIDVGAFGRQSDGGIFSASPFGQRLEEGIPELEVLSTLPNSEVNLPMVLVGDEAFPLKTYLMRPYPGKDLDVEKRVFNYRLSRARMVIENSFGILAARFRIFRGPISATPDRVRNIVTACVALHNYLRCAEINNSQPTSGQTLQDSISTLHQSRGFENITSTGSQNYTQAARTMRTQFTNYFMNEGAVSWQVDYAFGFRLSSVQ